MFFNTCPLSTGGLDKNATMNLSLDSKSDGFIRLQGLPEGHRLFLSA